MLNKAKDNLEIPDTMKDVIIAMIPKQGKGLSSNISNQRGVFILSIFRSILMKILLKDEYQMIDSYMSDSNVGGRKGRRIQDHLFVINGVIFEHARKRGKKPLTIGIYDYRLCFDSMWQEEVINDLFEAGIQDNKLALLYKINKTNRVAVKAADGLSERKEIKNVICQGDPWGSLECALQVDSFGKESLKQELHPYKYKEEVEIPALGVVDDIITISESGPKAAMMNSFINAKTALKKLHFGPDKCHVLHIGKDHKDFLKVPHYVEGWKVSEAEDFHTGVTTVEESYDGEHLMSAEGVEKYLGQIISSDSTNTRNIEFIRNKGIGITNKIVHTLSAVSAGKYHFEMAVILRNSYLISSILSSSEVWYGVTHAEIVKLEQIDEMLWLNILECSSSVPRDLIYLELGILRIRDIIITRRLMFLHHIMKQEKESLIYRFFIAQARSPTQNDWVSQVLKDLEDIELEIEFKDICSFSKDKFKEIVNEHVLKFSYSQLIQKKQNRTSDNAKGRNIKYICFFTCKIT